MAAPRAVRIELAEIERAELEARLRRRKVARGDALRAEIVLLAAEGLSNLAIVERLGVARMTVSTWRRRFAELRLAGLTDEPRPGAPRTVTDEKVAEVVTATLETLPAGRTHWSSRGMARAAEFRRFLDTVETRVPADLDIHVVMDNAASHKTKLVRD